MALPKKVTLVFSAIILGFVIWWMMAPTLSKVYSYLTWNHVAAGGVVCLVVYLCFRAKTSSKSGPFESRKTCLGFYNPKEWGFSMFRILHIVRHCGDYLRYARFHKASKPSLKELDEHLPAMISDLGRLKKAPAKGIQVFWIGHASLLVQIDGVNFLFDPVFYDCGPLLCGRLLSGYVRFRPPAITVGELARNGIEVHAVCISHNHYDHLDLRSVNELNDEYGNGIHWFVPKGMQRWFRNRGCEKVTDRDWWESSDECLKKNGADSKCKVAYTPAKHWSLRSLVDYYLRHLWGAWYVEGPKGSKFFFAGDTGYVEGLFESVKQKYGMPDVAAIPIGAYKPRAVMEAQHIDPLEAVKIHVELGASHSIGVHWGTFAMSNEKIHEPKEDLQKAIDQMKPTLKGEEKRKLVKFITLKHGEVRTFSTGDETPSAASE